MRSNPRSTKTRIAVAANGLVTLAMRNGWSSVRGSRVRKFARPPANVYVPFPGTRTATATLGRLLRLMIAVNSALRRCVTFAGKSAFFATTVDDGALATGVTVARRQAKRLRRSTLET